MPLGPVLNQGETRWFFGVLKKLKLLITRRLSGNSRTKVICGIQTIIVYNGIRTIPANLENN